MANYPTSAFSPTTKNAGDTITASHVNDLQAEVTAIETALLTTGLAHVLNVVQFGTHTFTAGGTGVNGIVITNTTAGTTNAARLRAVNDAGGFVDIVSYASTWGTANVYDMANGGSVGVNGAGGLSIVATHASGTIRFYAQGTAQSAVINSTGVQANVGGFYMVTWPTTASAANANVTDGTYVSRSTSSLRYKTDVVRLDVNHAKAVVASLSPITYRGVHDGDTRFAGFAAEEVAKVDPLLVTFDTQGRPDYVTYDRIPAYLVPVVQELMQRVAALEAR